MNLAAVNLEAMCKSHEAFETDDWAIPAILGVELLTHTVWDPCAGFGVMGRHLRKAGYDVAESDVVDWWLHFPNRPARATIAIRDFIATTKTPWVIDRDWTCFMNPPFSQAQEFISHANALGARKIVCFQSWAWRESKKRRDWWEENPPSRIWLCGERATCWRFDIPLDCIDPDGPGCGKGKGRDATRCRKCMAGTTAAHAWYVWERGHKGAEIINSIWRDG